MKYLIQYFTTLISALMITSQEIKQIYFDPQTTMSPSKQDGVVIVETVTGVKSTICMNFDGATRNAEVICRMMGYQETIGKPNAVGIISRKRATFSNGTHFQKIKCKGDESKLSECPGFKYYDETIFKCKNHNQDLHVFCLGNYRFENSTIHPPKSNCSANGMRIASLSNKKHGLLKIRNGNQEFTVCGINRNFGANEARLFCKELLCEKTVYARIIEGYYVDGSLIGGFKNMKCPTNAKSLSDCTNVYPYDNERCTPSDNIGVLCSSNPDIPDPYPEITCNAKSLTLFWEKKVHPDIKPDFVTILDNGRKCNNTNVDGSVRLSVNYTDCGMLKEGTNETIIYTFQAKRLYPKINNKVIIKNDQLYNVSCIIPRYDSASQVSFTISSTANLPIIGNNTPIPSTMIVSTNNKFEPVLLNIKDVVIGSEIFVKVHLIQPPYQLVPFLDNCFIESGILSEPLILNKCPVRPDLVISPLNHTTIMFSFKSFTVGNIGEPAFIKCVTSICGRDSVGCIPTCQHAF